jgi:AcrR family transcriptional regulator
MSPAPDPHSADPRARAAATKRNRTRRALLDAADATFTARGWVRTRIEDVASNAGVSSATAYNHFPAKHALIAEVFAPLIAPLVAACRAAAADAARSDTPPAEVVGALVTQIRALTRIGVRNRGITAAYWAATQDYTVRVGALPDPSDEQDPRVIAPVVDVLLDLVENGQRSGALRTLPPAAQLCPSLVDVLLARIALDTSPASGQLARLVATLALGALAPERVVEGSVDGWTLTPS